MPITVVDAHAKGREGRLAGWSLPRSFPAPPGVLRRNGRTQY